MAIIEEKLEKLGLVLPEKLKAPSGIPLPFSPVRIIGNRAIISGHGPQNPDGTVQQGQGKVGNEISVEVAQSAAKNTALSILSSLKRELGDLDRITAWVKVFGMVNADPTFPAHPVVINGFSDLILELWGTEVGGHSRSAIGVASLPFGMYVEIEGEVLID